MTQHVVVLLIIKSENSDVNGWKKKNIFVAPLLNSDKKPKHVLKKYRPNLYWITLEFLFKRFF